jgi:hypothetical protein
MYISATSTGSFDKTTKFLQDMARINSTVMSAMHECGQQGVNALSDHTPVSTGRTAHAWGYEVEGDAKGCSITWTNSDVESGFPVAIMLQYGYATGTGGYVQGRDYINPAIKPIFDQIADKIWKAVTSA